MSHVIRVTSKGVLVPRYLLSDWGNIKEVHVEQCADHIVIKPGAVHAGDQRAVSQRADSQRAEILDKMKAEGLIEEVEWSHVQVVSSQDRARLAQKLSQGKPLSQIILEDREDYS
jgi:membrane protein involved in colicin uptake